MPVLPAFKVCKLCRCIHPEKTCTEYKQALKIIGICNVCLGLQRAGYLDDVNVTTMQCKRCAGHKLQPANIYSAYVKKVEKDITKYETPIKIPQHVQQPEEDDLSLFN